MSRARWIAIAWLVGGCQPVDGAIFIQDDLGVGSSGAAGEAICGEGQPSRIEGNDPAFAHACGESCDTDWCACESCSLVRGPLPSVDGGFYALRLLGGSSGDGEFRVVLATDAGEPLIDAVLERNGIFDDSLPFEAPPGCVGLRFELIQTTDVCARVYEIEINPTP